MKEQYSRMKGWSGKRYYIRMSPGEIAGRRIVTGLWIGAVGIVSFIGGMILAMATC